ncbi:Phosphotyrosyl phosphatase activator [Kockovaella imperatae]|uniref:Serine/threonine-protein phosphatase 2A activator n=1 Tax=Kockovaella imperatae TaxID=4999 RepID=A0A1Y1UB83_9TREE|nr:Phosphotyrosyl phosphatase activator [Kockovaella imperatae]ORX34804.1 Phosphotyrosyl phosphatase activator [Kockovaella imperatae]
MQSDQPEASSSRLMTTNAMPSAPARVLTSDAAVDVWPATNAFRSFWEWTKQRCDRIKGKEILHGSDSTSEAITALMDLLVQMIDWIDEVPLQPLSSQRFGNLAFRDYIKLVDSRLPLIVKSFPNIPVYLPDQILPLLIQSTPFGQPTRLDYGTGHELAFVLVLWSCVASGWIKSEEEEDELILRVFPKYLELVTLLQKKYRLEPAGSHGVWGLDDYSFFPYLFGSAQLLDSSTTPAQALSNALNPRSPMTDMYTLSLHRVTLFKRGASFSEHSPMLHQLSTFPDWKKPHGGLRKMFLGEVIGKRVVIQSIWIGGLCGGDEVEQRLESQGIKVTGLKDVASQDSPITVTKAPWAP